MPVMCNFRSIATSSDLIDISSSKSGNICSGIKDDEKVFQKYYSEQLPSTSKTLNSLNNSECKLSML